MDVRIEKLISGAKGLGEINGKSIIVSNALPGELVDVEIESEKKSFIQAKAVKVLEPSEKRIIPVCPYYGICGGCDFQIVSEKDSAYLKQETIKDNMRRIGKLSSLPEFLPPVYGEFKAYRSRCRVHVDLKSKRQGFLSSKSNDLINLHHCPALKDSLNTLLEERNGRVYKVARSALFENRINKNTAFAEVPLFAGDCLVSDSSKPVDITIGDYCYSVSSNVFFQSNPSLMPSLFAFVLENAIGDNIMDLYSGVGTFSALFEGQGKTVYAVERQKECLALSKKNAPTAISYTADVAKWAKNAKHRVDTVIVDPPRVGLDSSVIDMISSWNPERIIYISCNSVTLARDLGLFTSYRAEKARVFDFYPGSSHVETVVLLSRK